MGQVCVSGRPKRLLPLLDAVRGSSRWSNQYIHFIQSQQMEKKQNAERNNKGGRPPKSTTDKLKYRVTVKLATPDYYTLKSRARSAGISASEYLRECFRKGYVQQRLTAEHSDYIRKLCGMANNLNQLAHKANAGGFDTAKLECRVQVARIEELLNHILL